MLEYTTLRLCNCYTRSQEPAKTPGTQKCGKESSYDFMVYNMIMSCGLTEKSLFILQLLYKNRCFNSSAGYNSEKLYSLFHRKFEDRRPKKEFETAINNLQNDGYITIIKKNKPKYFISEMKKTFYVLDSHGYPLAGGTKR